MKKSDHSTKFVQRIDTSGKNQDNARRDVKTARGWATSTQTICKTVLGFATALEGIANAAKVTDTQYAALVTKMIAIEDQIAPIEKSRDKADQRKVKELLAQYKRLEASANKTYKLMWDHVDRMKEIWKQMSEATSVSPAF